MILVVSFLILSVLVLILFTGVIIAPVLSLISLVSSAISEVLDTIVSMAPDRVVYVSCNPSTLARDLAYLDERGYKCIEIQPVDMFPHTMHVECVAKIVKK